MAEPTELKALWSAAGDNSSGQLGVLQYEGFSSETVENFTTISNGEMGDTHSFVDVESGGALNRTYLVGSDGRTYVTGSLTQHPSEAQIFAGVDSVLLSSLSNGITKVPRLAELLEMESSPPVPITTSGNMEQSLAYPIPLELRRGGSLWVVFRDNNGDITGEQEAVSSGVTSAIIINSDGRENWDYKVQFLRNGKLYKFVFNGATVGTGGTPFIIQNIAGGMRFKSILASPMNELRDSNYFLIDEANRLWVTGTNEHGQLGVRAGYTSWTQRATSSQVSEIISHGAVTFIKRKE